MAPASRLMAFGSSPAPPPPLTARSSWRPALLPAPRGELAVAAGQAGDGDVTRARVQADGARGVGGADVAGAGAQDQRPLRVASLDVGRGDVHADVAVDVGDERFADGEVDRDAFAGRDEDPQVGVGVEAAAAAGDAHAVAPAVEAAPPPGVARGVVGG